MRFDFRSGLVALAVAFALVPDASAGPLASGAEPIGAVASCNRIDRVEVRTGQRLLRAWCDGGEAIRMRVALGRRRDGQKRGRGDLRTPRGTYRVAGPARPSRFHLFIPIDYPSRVDAAEALARGRISVRTWRRILDAHSRGALPPQDTALGGHLGLHGQGPRWRGAPAHLDWTHGCIALGDDEIEFLATRLAPGTPVLLFP